MDLTDHAEDLIKESLKPIPNFGYSGERDLFKTWGSAPFTVTREGSFLDRSNWDTIISGLRHSEFKEGESWEIMGANHWAVGWVHHLIFDTQNLKLAEQLAAYQCSLADYPVLDDEDYSIKSFDAQMDYWASLSMTDKIDYAVCANESIFHARKPYEELSTHITDSIRESVES